VGDRTHYVFGYGSLLERWRRREVAGNSREGPRLATLRRYRRTWNVAMDNRQTIPGYKYYVDAASGERHDWFVTFLNVVPDPGSEVNGVLFAVTEEGLAELDERERNYERVEISADLAPSLDRRAWVYTGSAAAVGRFAVGERSDRAVISRAYYQRVLDDFSAIGPGALTAFEQLTDPPPCQVLDLRRVDVPDLSKVRAPSAVRDR
jgi:cation transport regulator ChaC